MRTDEEIEARIVIIWNIKKTKQSEQ